MFCRRTRAKRPSGTRAPANAIYQNIQFLEDYDPEYVLILSGDHIYKMDYNKMLQQHKETGADATSRCWTFRFPRLPVSAS